MVGLRANGRREQMYGTKPDGIGCGSVRSSWIERKAIHEPASRRQNIGPALETDRTCDWQAYTFVYTAAGSVTGDASQTAQIKWRKSRLTWVLAARYLGEEV